MNRYPTTKKVLFICMGNICRSAMAEGILRDKIRRHDLPLSVDSAGTHGYHDGGQYDRRARIELQRHGIDVDDLRSRRVTAADFEQFDVLFAADTANLQDLTAMFGDLAQPVQLMTAYAETCRNDNIPDPYYGGDAGFAHVYDMLDESISAWLRHEGFAVS